MPKPISKEIRTINGQEVMRMKIINNTSLQMKELRQKPFGPVIDSIRNSVVAKERKDWYVTDIIKWWKDNYKDVYGRFYLVNMAAKEGRVAESMNDFIYAHASLYTALTRTTTRSGQPIYTSFNEKDGVYLTPKTSIIKEVIREHDRFEAHRVGCNYLIDRLEMEIKNCPHPHTVRSVNQLIDHITGMLADKEYWMTVPSTWFDVSKNGKVK